MPEPHVLPSFSKKRKKTPGGSSSYRLNRKYLQDGESGNAGRVQEVALTKVDMLAGCKRSDALTKVEMLAGCKRSGALTKVEMLAGCKRLL